MKTMARVFILTGIPLPSCQYLITGPKRGWFINQLCQRFEAIEKLHALTNQRGTVGNRGKKMPAHPNARQNQPSKRNAIFFTGAVFSLLLFSCITDGVRCSRKRFEY